MTLKETDKKIEALFKEWKSLQPLHPDYRENLNKKIQLEWNYNSNRIEGNTLTYGETKLLLFFNRHEGGHHERNYTEMKAHDVAIKKINEFSKDKSRRLTEADIRDLNKIILKEPFFKKAQTPDGQPTQKEIIPGDYKKTPNHVKTSTGEIFKFVEPWEVPQKMQDLIGWFNTKLDSSLPSIASFIAELHHRFILIHPFDDGNGRVVRLWLNYTLLYLGYPPLVIKSQDKENYFIALNKADVGDMNSFAVYLGRILITWLEIGVKAAKGKDITEPSDIDKEVGLYTQEQKRKNLDFPLLNLQKVVSKMYDNLLYPFFNALENKFEDFSALFTERVIRLETPKISSTAKTQNLLQAHFIQSRVDDQLLWESLKSSKPQNLSQAIHFIKESFIDNQLLWASLKSSANIRVSVYYQKSKIIDKTTSSMTSSFNMGMFIDLAYFKDGYKIKFTLNKTAKDPSRYSEKKIERKEKYSFLWEEKNINDFVANIKKKFFLLLKKDL